MENQSFRRGFLTGAAAAVPWPPWALRAARRPPRPRAARDRRHRCCGRDKLARQAGDAHGIRGNR